MLAPAKGSAGDHGGIGVCFHHAALWCPSVADFNPVHP